MFKFSSFYIQLIILSVYGKQMHVVATVYVLSDLEDYIQPEISYVL